MRRPLLLAAAFAAAFPVAASAQTSGLFGGRGTSSQTTTPSVRGGSQSALSQSALGRSAVGSVLAASSLNTTGGSTNGTTGGLTGGASSGAGTGQAQIGQLSQTIGTGAFVGRSDTAGTFVGSRTAGQQGTSMFGQAGGATGRGMTGFGASGFGGTGFGGTGFGTTGFGGSGFGQTGFGSGGFNANGRNGDRDDPRQALRPTQRIAFDYPTASIGATVERASNRFADIAARRPELAGVTFATDDAGRVVLRGTVATQEAAELAAAFVRLEPGVREVVNELTVEREATP